jgi:hypothetical protein
MQLKEELTLIQRGNRSISEYLYMIKSLANEIALIDHPISDDDLTLYVLHGLGPEFHEITIWLLLFEHEKNTFFLKNSMICLLGMRAT